MNVSHLIKHLNQTIRSPITYTYSMLKILSSNFGSVSPIIFIRRQNWTKSSKLRRDVEAVRRWKEENTRLFGPILKTNNTDSSRKKSRSKKSNEVVVGKDLDNWFDEHYPTKKTDSEHGKNKNGIDNPVQSSSQDKSDSTLNTKPEVSTDHEKDVLQEILRCNITSEMSSGLQQLKSHLQQSPLPSLPTVTGILAKTRSPESQFFLDRWKAKMISELGEEGFKKYQKETLQRGINLHTCIQELLSGVANVEPQPENQGFWNSIQQVIPAIEDVQALENRVRHTYLHYSGTYDCVATYKGTVCMIDWKTSQKPKPHLTDTFDYPLQVSAYIGAHNADPSTTVKLASGLVVVAYPDGTSAHAHYMSPDQCQYYWKQWLDRLYQYWNSVLYPTQNTG